MSIDCNLAENANNAICICKKGVDSYIDSINKYNNDKAFYNAELASYNRYKNELDNYNNLTGNYTDYNKIKQVLTNQKSTADICMPDNQVYNETHNDWCEQAFGNNVPGSWYHVKDGVHDCALRGGITVSKPYCKRTANQVNLDLQKLTPNTVLNNIMGTNVTKSYGDAKPISDPTQPDKIWNGKSEPIFNSILPNMNITCCSQVIDDLKAGRDINIEKIQQNCGNNTNEKDTNNKTNTIVKEENFFVKYKIYIIITIIFLILFSIMSSILII